MKTKQKWYHTTGGIITLLMLCFPVGFYFMWRHTHWQKHVKWGVTGFLALIVLIRGITPDSKPTPAATPNTQASQTPPTQAVPPPTIVTKKLAYEVVQKEVHATIENYKVLIPPGEDAQAVAMEVQTACSKPCTISVFDDRKALDLLVEYDTMMGDPDTPISAPQAWKTKHYVFVADHLVGEILFETGKWTAYPHQDWHYKELKGE